LGEKLRALRGTLCSKIRTAISDVFGSHQIPPIKSNAKSQEIINWKKLPEIKNCYKKMFEKSDFPGNLMFIEEILNKVWPSTSERPEHHVAWAISIVQTILNPKNAYIKITEDVVKHSFLINLVSIYNFIFKNILKIC